VIIGTVVATANDFSKGNNVVIDNLGSFIDIFYQLPR
jgi:hypothetical protein